MAEDSKELISLDEKSKLTDSIKFGSRILILELATAIQIGKLPPLGYEVAANFFRNQKEKIKFIHSAWLLAEAEIANKKEELEAEFPDTQKNIDIGIKDMEENIGFILEAMKREVASPNWDYKQVLRREKVARSLYKKVFPE